MPLVFITPYKKTYSSSVCSLSTLIGFILLILTIFIPLLASFSSEDFWLRLKEYMEQPIVEFSNDYLLSVTSNIGTKNIKSYFYSSNSKLNEKFENISKHELNAGFYLEDKAQITSSSFDDDNDGIDDRIIIKYETSEKEIFDSDKKDIKFIFFLKYRLMKQVKLLMTPMIYVDIPIIGKGGKQIDLNGDIELIQKSPIVSTTITSQIYNEENPLFVNERLNSAFDMLHLYNKYKNLNYTLKYNYEKIEQNLDERLIVNIEIHIPKLQRVLYIQSVYDAIKYAWMQYFYIFIPIYIILYSIYKFIIESNIFYSHAKSDL